MLMEAGQDQGGTGGSEHEVIEKAEVGIEGGPLFAFGFFTFSAGFVSLGGRFGFGPGADILADDTAIDPAGACVITAAIGAGFPGHGMGSLEAAQFGGRYTTGERFRREVRTPGRIIVYICSYVKSWRSNER